MAVIAGNSARPFFMERLFSASGTTRPALPQKIFRPCLPNLSRTNPANKGATPPFQAVKAFFQTACFYNEGGYGKAE